MSCPNCNKLVAVPKSTLDTGCVIDDFVIESEIGHGGMATVYLAKQLSMDRPVALKVLAAKYTREQSFVEMFLKEAKAAARLNHSHIIQALAVGRDGDYLFYAMEYVKGMTLSEYIEKEKRLEIDEALNVVQQVAEGLYTAWTEEELIHRDIKPDNIMITEDGHARIMDLGIAVRVSEAANVEVSGTPKFMAPEQFRAEALDCRTDLYSLGVTLYNAIVGYPPYEGDTLKEIAWKHMNEEVDLPGNDVMFIPHRVKKLISRMMAKTPDQRFPGYDELLEEIVSIRKRLAPDESMVPSVHTISFSKYRIRDSEAPSQVFRRRKRNERKVAMAKKRANEKETRKASGMSPYMIAIPILLACIAALLILLWAFSKRPSEFALQAESFMAEHGPEATDPLIVRDGHVVLEQYPEKPNHRDRTAFLRLNSYLIRIREAQLIDKETQLASLKADLENREMRLNALEKAVDDDKAKFESLLANADKEREALGSMIAQLKADAAAIQERNAALKEEAQTIALRAQGIQTDYHAVIQLRLNERMRSLDFEACRALIQNVEATDPAAKAWKAQKLREIDDCEKIIDIVRRDAKRFEGILISVGTVERIGKTQMRVKLKNDEVKELALGELAAVDILKLAKLDWEDRQTFVDAQYHFAMSWGDFQLAQRERPDRIEATVLKAFVERCFEQQMNESRTLVNAGSWRVAARTYQLFKNRYDQRQLELLKELISPRKSATTTRRRGAGAASPERGPGTAAM